MKPPISCAVWETTLACNMSCSHCGSSAGTPREDELTTEECYQVIEDLASLGTATVALMGGEPFMRPDWYRLGRCVRELGMEVSLVSNGIELPRHVKKLAELEPKVVGLSLDGLEATHDTIRRPGSFQKVMESVDALAEHDIQTTLITSVSTLNFKELPRMKELIQNQGANWQVQIAMPFGNFSKEFLISEEQYYAVAMFIAAQRLKNKFEELPVIGAHCFGYFSKKLPGCRGWKGCTAGLSSLGLTSNGGVVGCLSMGNDRFLEGNVRERRLVDIWDDPRSFAYNRSFTTGQLGPNCQGCKHGKKCKGGCNSMSMNLSGELHNDPYCFFSLENSL